jgi:hypothetical protein
MNVAFLQRAAAQREQDHTGDRRVDGTVLSVPSARAGR